MRNNIAVVLAVGIVVAIAAVPAGAFTMAEKVVVANSLVLVSRAPAGGLDAQDRISAVNDRLAPILGYELLTPENIRLRRFHGETSIFVGNRLLTTVTVADARANGTSVYRLARVWLRNARMALPQARPYANLYLTR
ncbi:MAG: hypothetical protein Q7T82_18455 [Armatimonadota bacterium]|nr:hypothetical protein [Armatimonadota bacterium]